ncbi:MAG: hypothetical protein U0P45_11030 [Acidimicrobiales bacterium]
MKLAPLATGPGTFTEKVEPLKVTVLPEVFELPPVSTAEPAT